MGIEPTQSAWKAEILPLNYTRPYQSDFMIIARNRPFVNTFFQKYENFCKEKRPYRAFLILALKF